MTKFIQPTIHLHVHFRILQPHIEILCENISLHFFSVIQRVFWYMCTFVCVCVFVLCAYASVWIELYERVPIWPPYMIHGRKNETTTYETSHCTMHICSCLFPCVCVCVCVYVCVYAVRYLSLSFVHIILFSPFIEAIATIGPYVFLPHDFTVVVLVAALI